MPPLELTTAGLEIQTLSEIKGEMNDSVQSPSVFGPDFDVSEDTPEGNFIGVFAERERKIQESIESVHDSANPAESGGKDLDDISSLFGTKRLPAESSTILGKVTGVDTTVIPAGKQVRFDGNADETVWVTTTAVVIGASGPSGEEPVTVRAVLTGEVQAAISAAWTILTPVGGWTAFESTAAVVLGSVVEPDKPLRDRRKEEVFTLGSSNLPSIIANVQQVTGVTSVEVFENRKNVTVAPLPAKSFQVLVEGGDDQDIADEIFNNKPGGIEPFGDEGPFTVTEPLTGKDYEVDFSRPTFETVWLDIEVTTTGAEDAFPAGGEALIEADVLAFAVANHAIGDDVIPDFFHGTIYATVGNKSIIGVAVKTSLVGFGGAVAVLPIDSRAKATFDAVRIQVTQV